MADSKIRILCTSDVHGCIEPYRWADGSPVNQGMARLSTLIKERRDADTILVDNGDTLQGSAFAFWHFTEEKEETAPITEVMKAMGYDFMNLGNHDFNYGKAALHHHIRECGASCLTCNVVEDGKPEGHEYAVRCILGKKLAFIAVTTQYVPHWESKENIAGMEFLDAFETLKSMVEKVKREEHPDYIVGMYHGGVEENPATDENEGWKMLEEIDGLDVLLCGHTHQTLCTRQNGVVVTETRHNGVEIAEVLIDPETGEITASILPADTEADEEILKLVQDKADRCSIWLDQPLGTTDMDLSVTDEFEARLHKAAVVSFLNRVQLDESGAELSATALFENASGFGHEITMRNLVSTYIYPNTLVVKRISGRGLKAYLEKCAGYWALKDDEITVSEDWLKPIAMHFNYDMLDGCEYTISVSRPIGERITSLTYQGKEVKDDDMFTLAVNNYRAAGGGGFPMIQEAETVKEIQKDMVDVIAEWIMSHPSISFAHEENIHVVK